VAKLNGQEVKLVEAQGAFPWYRHDDVGRCSWSGAAVFASSFRDRIVVLEGPGEIVVVPRGVEHRTAADEKPILLSRPGLE
jgi:hypothetical protein